MCAPLFKGNLYEKCSDPPLPLSSMEEGAVVAFRRQAAKVVRRTGNPSLLSFPTFRSAPSPFPAYRTRYTGIPV